MTHRTPDDDPVSIYQFDPVPEARPGPGGRRWCATCQSTLPARASTRRQFCSDCRDRRRALASIRTRMREGSTSRLLDVDELERLAEQLALAAAALEELSASHVVAKPRNGTVTTPADRVRLALQEYVSTTLQHLRNAQRLVWLDTQPQKLRP